MRLTFLCAAALVLSFVASQAPPQQAEPVLAAAVAALKTGATPGFWMVEGEGRENLTGELQGLAPDLETWRAHQERVAVDAGQDAAGWERHTPRNDGSLRHRRFVYRADARLILDHANDMRRATPGAVPLEQRRALMRRIPHLLVADAWRERARARWLRATTVEGRQADEIVVDFPNDGAVRLVVGREPAVVLEAAYDLYFPGRGDTTVGWRWTGWKPDPALGHVPAGHRITIGGVIFQEVRYTRFGIEAGEARTFLDPPAAPVRGDAGMAMEATSWAAAAGPASGEVAPGVHVARLGGFTVLFVEMGDGVVAFEAPEPFFGTESIPASSRAAAGTLSPQVIAHIRKTIPGKRISHVVVSHHHGDHMGGIRAFAEAGAVVIVPQSDVEAARRALAGVPGTIEGVDGMRVLSDGARRIEIRDVGPNPHTRANLLMWLPGDGVLVQGDLFYFDAGVGFHRGRDRMNRFFAGWLAAQGIAPRVTYGVHNTGGAGGAALAQALIPRP